MTHQTRSAIRIEIIDALVELGRPAIAQDVSSWLFTHSRIDGTRSDVSRTVEFEMGCMYEAGILDASRVIRAERDGDLVSQKIMVYTLHDLLTTIAMITAD